MREEYPEKFEINSDVMLFASQVAIDMDNHRLGKKGVKVHYNAISRMGKIIHDYSQDLKKPLGCFPGTFEIFGDAVEKTFSKHFKEVREVANKLEEISQDFAGFDSLTKEKQGELVDFCANLSLCISARYVPSMRGYYRVGLVAS